MITTHELIAKLNESGVEFSVKYLHPNLYIINVDERYSNTENDQRIELFAAQVNIATQDFIELEHNSSIQLCLVTPEERNSDYSFLDEENKRHHWIEVLSGAKQENTNTARSFKTLHFYGYKGGQARSTVLGVLSKFLADQGYKILIIDADIEAPSLDKIFQTKTTRLSETLLGICHFRTEVSTANAYTQKNGKIDLIACRPDNETFDIDFSTFSLHTSLDPVILKNGLTRIGDFAESFGYDFVFIDHRTGISGSVIPLALSLPGPVISFARRDTQSLSGARIFKSLFNLNSGPPGIYVSFSLDPEFKRTGLSQEALKIQEELLMQFPEGFRADVEDAIDSYWIDWFHNKSLVSGTIPDIRKLNPENLSAIREISSVLGLSNEPPHLSKPETPPIDQPLTSSGSTDPGIYLEADFLKRLLSPNSPINYILGRKGTGKTRLVRELHARGLGRPILTAADYNHDGGIGSAAACFKTLVDRRRGSPQSIWCALLHAAIESNYATAQTLTMEESITKNIDREITFQDIKTLLNDQNYQTDHFTFLVDGIETAFPSNEIKKNIESLFSFLLTIQSDSFLSQKITIRLFIRSDLAKNAIENIEQQLDGRTINLVWDEQSIFNFVLLRINQKNWFRTRFPEACEKLKLHEDRLKSGNITADEYEPLLMEFFPLKLRASNIQTITFLRTYFSDTVDSTYSPRLYDRFLEFLTDREKVRVKESEILESHRLGQKLISQAHQAASEYYLSEVSAELKYMLNPEVDIQKFTEGFNGLSTPFNVEVCVRLLHEKTRIETSLVRESMNIMKDIGMFELRPGFSEQWRVGRLFKSSLGMKYVRGTKLTSEVN